MATILDLVKRCPSCKRVAVWPFTQDHTTLERYPVTADEFSILKKHYPTLVYAYSIGAIVKTHKDTQGNLWHEPCYFLHEMRMFQQSYERIACLIAAHFRIPPYVDPI